MLSTETLAIPVLRSVIVKALLEPSRSIPEFVACARMLALTSSVVDVAAPIDVSHGRRILIDVGLRPARPHPHVAVLIARFEAAAKGAHRLRERRLALELGVDAAHLGRQLRAESGFGFREWKVGAQLRLAVQLLAKDADHVSVIATQSGWRSVKQFDRHFRQWFATTPTAFRRLVDHASVPAMGLL
jgi:AraC-like DNA-binding protein